MTKQKELEKFIQDLARAAGKLTAKKFGLTVSHQMKTHKLDLVTEADLASNALILGRIKKNFPAHGIISEETGEYNVDAECVWIIDPIDGTLNFSKKIALYVVLIALKKRGVLELACAYDPIHDEMYFAKRNGGAFRNGKRIRCSPQPTLIDSCGLMSDRLTKERQALTGKILRHLKGGQAVVSSYHCAGLSGIYVADGRKDWNITSGQGHVWDYAAPFLIAAEAGCKVAGFNGEPWDFKSNKMIVANPVLYDDIVKAVGGKGAAS